VSIYVNKENRFEQGETISRECPHCGAHAQLLPIATPDFEAVLQTHPRQVGLAFACAACKEPRFARTLVRAYTPDRIELSSHLAEVERPREKFQYHYLPEHVEPLFREALECYAAGYHNAFASMCRRTVDVSLTQLGHNAKMRWFELYQDVVQVGEIDQATAQTIENVLFGSGTAIPEITPESSAVLIEVIRDIVYQCYVRTAKLRAAMKMRRFFAGEQADNITPLERPNRRLESA
jgi:hypothetical protein